MSTDEGITVRSASNSDCGEVRKLVFGILAEYGLDPDPEGIDDDLLDIESSYIRRGGAFELLEDENGDLLGTVGLYPIDDETVELRKMYLAKEIRGRGLGKKTLRRMIGIAREKGFETITLETASVLKEAIGLYRSFGFVPDTHPHAQRCDQSFHLKIS